MTYTCLNEGSRDPAWAEFVQGRDNNDIIATRRFADEDLDELSDAELESLEAVWSEFGGRDQWKLVDYTHVHCPEWEDPHGSSTPIPHSRVYKFLGFEDAEEREAEIMQERAIEEIFASVRS